MARKWNLFLKCKLNFITNCKCSNVQNIYTNINNCTSISISRLHCILIIFICATFHSARKYCTRKMALNIWHSSNFIPDDVYEIMIESILATWRLNKPNICLIRLRYTFNNILYLARINASICFSFVSIPNFNANVAHCCPNNISFGVLQRGHP